MSRMSQKILQTISNLGSTQTILDYTSSKNIVWLVLEKASIFFSTLISSALIARYLGPNQYGNYIYVSSIIIIFQSVAMLGSDQFIVKDLSIRKYETTDFLKTIFILRLISGAFCVVVVNLFINYTNPNDNIVHILSILMSSSLILQSIYVLELWCQSQRLNYLTAQHRIISYSVMLVLRILFVWMKLDLLYFGLTFLLDYLFIACAIYSVNIRRTIPKFGKFKSSIAVSFAQDAWPFMVTSIFVIIYSKIDLIMVRHYLDAKALGIYSIGITIPTYLGAISVVLGSVFAPLVAQSKISSSTKYNILIQNITSVIGISAALIAVLCFIFARPLIDVLYGKTFAESVNIFRISTANILFISLGVAQSLFFLNEKKGGLNQLKRCIVGCLTLVILGFITIPRYGINGAALSTVIAFFVTAVGVNMLYSRRLINQMVKAFSEPFKLLWVYFKNHN